MISFGMPSLIEKATLEENAALCRELGLDFVELNMSFPQYQQEALDADKLRSVAQEYGIYYTLHVDEELNICSLNTAVAEAYTASLLQTAKMAKALGIPTLNMHLSRGVHVTLPSERVYIYNEHLPLYLDRLCRFRDAFSEAVDGSDVKLCIENTDGYENFRIQGIDLLLESPAFALTYDIGHNCEIGGGDEPIILQRAARLRHMHMHDASGNKVHLALGDGSLDLGKYLSLADEHDCSVVLETKTVEALRKSLAWLNKKRQEV